MPKIRALVVDDSVVVRRLVSDALAADPGIEVVGSAANGRIALAKVTQLAPDVITLDVEMPEMDGLETLAELRRTHPRLPVIMFSTLTERGASATLEALAAGASDYVTKPSNVGSVSLATQRIREELIPKIRALCGRPLGAALPAPRPAPRLPLPARSPAPTSAAGAPRRGPAPRVDVVAIGVSTGGPAALAAVLPALPGDLAVPVLIVQHMPPVFTAMLASRLDGQSGLRVTEAVAGERVAPGRAWIAPGDFHMTVERAGADVVVRTHQGPPENSCRPAVDVLFRSVAAAYGPHALAVVLTGMGQDGLRGAESIHEAGGTVLAQDKASSVVWGMPGFVAQSGLAERVLPLDQVASEITRRVALQRGPVLATRGA